MPKVSVCVITYNHERYIADCLNSLVNQSTSFEYEIIVAEDCSVDGTRQIVLDFARRFPELIKPLLPSQNLGGTQNFLALHRAATGDYVANVDGDDLALPGKLARQAALLDARPDLVGCGHRARVITEEGEPTGGVFPRKLASEFGLAEAFKYGMPVLNSTIMYRREVRNLLHADFEVYDWYFLTDLLLSGRFGYIDEDFALYRLNSRSMTADLGARMMGVFLETYARRLDERPQYRPEFYGFAFVDLVTCIKNRWPISSGHRKLLREHFSPLGFVKAIDTVIWRLENRSAFVR